MIIVYHKNFTKNFKKLSSAQKNKFYKRQTLFEIDEFSPILNNHALTGKYKGYRTINITGDLRLLYRIEGEVIIFVTIDSHSNLYG